MDREARSDIGAEDYQRRADDGRDEDLKSVIEREAELASDADAESEGKRRCYGERDLQDERSIGEQARQRQLWPAARMGSGLGTDGPMGGHERG